MDKKTFLIIAPTPFYEDRGCHMRIRGEAEALQRKGYRIAVATYGQGRNVKGLKIARSFFKISFPRGPAASWKKIPADILLLPAAVKAGLKLKPDIIYCHLHEGVLLGLLVKICLKAVWPLKEITLIMDSQGSLSGEMKSYGMARLTVGIWKAIEWIIESIPKVIFTSYPGSGRKEHYLPDAVSLFGFSFKGVKKIDKAAGLREAAKFLTAGDKKLAAGWIKGEKAVLVYTGSFGKSKGFPRFLKHILPKLAKDEKLCFLLVGGSKEYCSKYVQRAGISKQRVIVVENVKISFLPYLLSLSDIAFDPKLPSVSQSSGKIINYMASGLPVVCFSHRSNRDYLGEGGLYARSYIQFANHVLKLARNSSMRKRLGERNIRRAWKEFNWDKSVRIIEEALSLK